MALSPIGDDALLHLAQSSHCTPREATLDLKTLQHVKLQYQAKLLFVLRYGVAR
jgi:hypothetical protein